MIEVPLEEQLQQLPPNDPVAEWIRLQCAARAKLPERRALAPLGAELSIDDLALNPAVQDAGSEAVTELASVSTVDLQPSTIPTGSGGVAWLQEQMGDSPDHAASLTTAAAESLSRTEARLAPTL